MADLYLAAGENPVTAGVLTAVPAGAARIEDLIRRGPAAPSGTRAAVRSWSAPDETVCTPRREAARPADAVFASSGSGSTGS
ncbi:hypothetical protein ACFYS8_17625 [Kitasatospora sp. NPDC004615]|uniref:hypothetical protein n=1 Tax=Kitasatospora sp. NPDC004615 TaxID=3364017 RepID=UPI0036CC4C90